MARKIPPAVARTVYERDGNRCTICRRRVYWGKDVKRHGVARRRALDHIIPFSVGGPTTAGNLRVVCTSCNSRKGSDYEGEWLRPLAPMPDSTPLPITRKEPAMKRNDELLDVDGVSEYLNVSIRAVRSLIANRAFPVVKIGQRCRVSTAALETYIEAQTRGAQ